MNNYLREVLNGKITYEKFNLGKPPPTPPPSLPHMPAIAGAYPLLWVEERQGRCCQYHRKLIIEEPAHFSCSYRCSTLVRPASESDHRKLNLQNPERKGCASGWRLIGELRMATAENMKPDIPTARADDEISGFGRYLRSEEMAL
jgi:hypothetical protein